MWLILGGLLAVVLVVPIDGAISSVARAWTPGGDVRREMEVIQQYGGLSSLVLVAVLVALLDPGRARRLLDLGVATGLTALAALAAKMLVGRPRPRFDDPGVFLGPFGAYPLGPERGVRYAWEFWAPISSDLWSMPSSHTSAAVALSVFLARVYPRLWALALGLSVLVGTARVVLGAHYASDVIGGAVLGYAVGGAAVRGGWGVRLVDWLWRTLVDRSATPAWAGIAERERTGV